MEEKVGLDAASIGSKTGELLAQLFMDEVKKTSPLALKESGRDLRLKGSETGAMRMFTAASSTI